MDGIKVRCFLSLPSLYLFTVSNGSDNDSRWSGVPNGKGWHPTCCHGYAEQEKHNRGQASRGAARKNHHCCLRPGFRWQQKTMARSAMKNVPIFHILANFLGRLIHRWSRKPFGLDGKRGGKRVFLFDSFLFLKAKIPMERCFWKGKFSVWTDG